jgi:diguanylate cyclase (GGDEF)-like protein
LTGLPNRRLLMDRLDHSLKASARNNNEGALLFLDLDKFKNINDTLGHNIGDLLLQGVAKRLKDSIREGDTVARIGGDEFVIILEGLDKDSDKAILQAQLISNKILSSLEKPYQLGEHEISSKISIGATLFRGHKDIDKILKQADTAMYQAKEDKEDKQCAFFLKSKL